MGRWGDAEMQRWRDEGLGERVPVRSKCAVMTTIAMRPFSGAVSQRLTVSWDTR